MTESEIIELAEKYHLHRYPGWLYRWKPQLIAFATEIRNRTLESAIGCYSPDDSANDWMDKLNALKNPLNALDEYRDKLREDMTGITSYMKGDEK